jgi:hypothetical protein
MTDFGYTQQELRSYLPTGWALAGTDRGGGDRGQFDAKSDTWKVSVTDSTEQAWDLVVKAKEVANQGRIGALKSAFDKLFRERLG